MVDIEPDSYASMPCRQLKRSARHGFVHDITPLRKAKKRQYESHAQAIACHLPCLQTVVYFDHNQGIAPMSSIGSRLSMRCPEMLAPATCQK